MESLVGSATPLVSPRWIPGSVGHAPPPHPSDVRISIWVGLIDTCILTYIVARELPLGFCAAGGHSCHETSQMTQSGQGTWSGAGSVL